MAKRDTMGQCLQGNMKPPRLPRPPYSRWPETMCFQSDLTSNVAFFALKELQEAGRLKILSVQKAWLLGMEGTKGKPTFGRSANTAFPAFARSAAHVFRMVMLEACGIDPQNWPTGGESSYRNEDKIKFEQVLGPKFVMADSYEEGREYWSEFDKIYPHYLVERYLEEGVGDLNRTMIVFKNYMQEVAEITLNVCAKHQKGTTIRCCVSCTVVHRAIDIGRAEGPWLDVLALAVRGSRCPLINHYDRVLDMDTSVMTEMQLEDTFNRLYLSLPRSTAEIDDTDDCVQQSNQQHRNEESTRLSVKFQAELNDQSGHQQSDTTVRRQGQEAPAFGTSRSEKVITNTKTLHRGNQLTEETLIQREVLVNPEPPRSRANSLPAPGASADTDSSTKQFVLKDPPHRCVN